MLTSSRAREAKSGRRRLARAGLLTLALAVAAALVLLASACSGSSDEGVASVDATETTTTTTGSEPADGSQSADWTAYSACMRENGVPQFPDPPGDGGDIQVGPGLDPSSPQFKAAEAACEALDPKSGSSNPQQQARQLQKLLPYAACMRAHGVPNFPDPKASAGGITFEPSRGSVDSNSPEFKAAEKACRELLPGGSR